MHKSSAIWFESADMVMNYDNACEILLISNIHRCRKELMRSDYTRDEKVFFRTAGSHAEQSISTHPSHDFFPLSGGAASWRGIFT
jgi:hypothetical protein